jgi:hypothetical protein
MLPTATEDLSDAQLVAAVADELRRPRIDPADSFVLHAPLELASRAALLPRVAPAGRAEARRRLVELASGYEAAGAPVPDPPSRDFTATPDAARRLREAIDAGDLDEVDAVARWLGRAASPTQLRRLLADTVVARLAAAAHAPIFLYQLPRISPRGELTGELLRPLARELARDPEWRLSWHDKLRPRDSSVTADEVFDAIAATPRTGLPGSGSIYPVMSQAQDSGIAADQLAGVIEHVDPHEAALAVTRAAASSMLQEPSDWAPYGWSHCLTLPQAVLGIADACSNPTAPVAVAATFVVGFRAAMAERPLVAGTELPELTSTVTEIVTYAATHHDAHLVKYTLACLDAAAADPSHAALYLAATQKLGTYWREHAPAA